MTFSIFTIFTLSLPIHRFILRPPGARPLFSFFFACLRRPSVHARLDIVAIFAFRFH